MKLEEDMKELYRILDEQKKIESELKFHKAYICQQHCPVKIGDEVVCNGYASTGKKFIVDYVWLHKIFSLNKDKYQFRASGRIKKKDGTLGIQKGEWVDKQ